MKGMEKPFMALKKLYIVLAITFAILANTRLAFSATDDIPALVENNHWSCQELADLAARYDASRNIPDGVFVEKQDLAAALLAVLEKVVERCSREGRDGIPKGDLERITRLHEALKADLALYEGYLIRRDAIEDILAKPDETKPPFEYSVGMGGFLRGEGAGNFRLSDASYAPNHGEGRFLYRVKPFVYWHPSNWLDIHVEGQGYGYSGGGHQERNRFSLYQGFAEFKAPSREWLSLKGGRQEFSYGSTFIIGSNSFYDGLVFDAARLRVKPNESLSLDLLLGTYAHPFNNGLSGNLGGAYATYAFDEATAAEIYFFRDSGSVDHHAGEHLYIWGGRGTAKIGPLSVEAELVYESGKQFNSTTNGNDSIDAYGGHLDLTHDSVIAGYNNKFFISYAHGSGSKDSANGVKANREFRNPNNDISLMGDMGVVGDFSGLTIDDHHASGLHVYTLGWGIDLTKAVNFSATGRYFIADQVEEGFSRKLGVEADFTVTYSASENISCIIGYDHFFTGGFFRDASGNDSDIHYGYAMLQFNLEKSKPRLKSGGG